jgi:Mce-associated membrane protein
MPPRRRTTTTPGVGRRPRVAGLSPVAARPEAPAAVSTPEPARSASTGPTAALAPRDTAPGVPGTTAATAMPASAAVGTAPEIEDTAGTTRTPAADPAHDAATRAAGADDAARPGRPARVATSLRARPVATLGVALAVSGALAAGLGIADYVVRHTPAAANTALADIGTTADVAGQLDSALETVYSYDFSQLDENERLAREVITPEFAVKFDQLFAQVRQLAPQQQAVVSATVTSSAVQSIEGDRAVLVAFLDQQATRASAGAEPQQLNAAGRLTVIAQRDGDAWKIADVVNR